MEMGSTIGSRLLFRKKNASVGSFLPDEIIENILSRLSVKFVIRCRLVCKRWRDLTLNRDFVDLKFRESLPLVLVANFHDKACDLIMLEKWWGPSRSITIPRFRFHYRHHIPDLLYPLFSQGGLLVFNNLPTSLCPYFIFNPIYPAEIVRITFSRKLRFSEIYGVYFHPTLKEYCSLWKIKTSDRPWGFFILTLGSKPSLKTVSVSNRLLGRVKKTPTRMLLIGNYLYWMLEGQRYGFEGQNDIMKFDIMSEELIVIPCPVPTKTACTFNQTNLLDIDGVLSYLLVSPSRFTIWRLKDDKEQLWTKSKYNIKICINIFVQVIAVVNGNLAFLWDQQLYICNLVEGTVKKCRKRKWCIKLSHQMSLASLSNCKPTIAIEQHQYEYNKVVVVQEENE